MKGRQEKQDTGEKEMGQTMLTTSQIEDKLYRQAELFKKYIWDREYAQAKSCYDTARDVALFVDLAEEKRRELFGDRQQEPPLEGLFPEDLVQKAYYEVAVKRHQEQQDLEKEIQERK